jgi:hypothetical protein
MQKAKTRRKTIRPKVSATRRQALLERRELERSVRHERKIKHLCGELRRAVVKADDALRAVGRMAVERDMPTASSLRDRAEDLDPATVGAGSDPRD